MLNLSEMVQLKLSNNIILTPNKIAKEMVYSIPDDIIKIDIKILDPVCKSGIFLRYWVDRLSNSSIFIKAYPNKLDREEYILKNCVFGISLNEYTKQISERMLNGCIGKYNNIILIDDYIEKIKNKQTDFKKLVTSEFSKHNKEIKEDMQFDVVIGNPPYQESTGGGNGGSGTALYHVFIEKCMPICEQLEFIIPARWLSDNPNGMSKKSLEKLRTLDNIRNIKDFGDKQVFSNVNIAGGVCILHLDNNISGNRIDTNGIIIRDLNFRNIINKIISDNKFISLSEYIDSDCFRSGSHMNSGWDNFSSIKDDYYNIKYYCSTRDSILGYGYVNSSEIIKNTEVVGKYKVAMKSASPTDSLVLYKGFIMEPNSCCSRSYVVIHSDKFNSLDSCNNIIKYTQTKFMRACVKAIKNTQNASKQAYKFVPLQDFTSNSDIDWLQSIDNIDKQLYKKYNLTQEEIDYIEKTIKPMI